jgi:antitoxin component YwqK of YwqJK toxin-antitoxin module
MLNIQRNEPFERFLRYLYVMNSLSKYVQETMKGLLTVLMALSGLLVSAQVELSKIDGLYCTADGKPYTGEYVTYHSNGHKATVYHLKEGHLHNTALTYKKNGTLDYSGSYFYGKKDGTWQQWDDHGKLVATAHYEAGSKTGEWMIHDPFNNDGYLIYYARDQFLSGRKVDPTEWAVLQRRN